MTRIVVFGAGAIGSALAAWLKAASCDVAMVARGAHLARIQSEGLLFEDPHGGSKRLTIEAAESGLAPADIVIVTLKSYALSGAAEAIARLRAPEGIVLFLQNGLPWWYFRGLEQPLGGRTLPMLDPGGVLAASFPPGTLAGGVVSLSASLVEPGWVRHTGGLAMSLGRPEGVVDDRLRELGASLTKAGLQPDLPGDPRLAVWTKLTVNVALNGVAALTGSTVGDIWDDDGLRRLVHRLAGEVIAVASSLGYPVKLDLEERRRLAVKPHRSSTLQDIEAGRPIEYDALFGALQPMAQEAGVAIPHIETVSALLRRRALELGCLPP
jgi:2-dehydropantoate 2-reductase